MARTPKELFALVRAPVETFIGWWRAESLVWLTGVLVLLTALLIVATFRLERVATIERDTIQKEESIIGNQASDSPPQLELVAHVRPPSNPTSIGTIDFRNQGTWYVSVAYAWCWGDDAPAFNTKRTTDVQPARQILGIIVHGSKSMDFAACSGAVGQLATPHEPKYLYSFIAFETPSKNCRNLEQFFLLSGDKRTYDNLDDPGTFPPNLYQTAANEITRKIQEDPPSDGFPSSCLDRESKL